MAQDKDRPRKPDEDLLEWFTVSYRTLYILAGVLIVLGAVGGYVYYRRNLPPSPPPGVSQTTTSARFASLEGSVQVRASGTLRWINAERNTVLGRSDMVRTGPQSTAEIRFLDGTVFNMRPDSLITLEESSENPASKQRGAAARISSGEINFGTTGSDTRISTPNVETMMRQNTEGNIQVQDSGEMGMRIFRGQSVARTVTGQRFELNPNEGIKVDAAGKPGQKMTLPGIPVLVAPPQQAEIAYPDIPRATTLFAWKGVPGASAYHIMLDYGASFARPIVDRQDWKEVSYEMRGLEVSTYFWRVSAIDKDGGEGDFSETARFAVTKSAAGPAPPLFIDVLESRGNVLQVKGRTEPGASLTVNAQRVDVAADGSFNEFITFESGKQTVVVRATGVGGGVAEQKRTVVVAE